MSRAWGVAFQCGSTEKVVILGPPATWGLSKGFTPAVKSNVKSKHKKNVDHK